MEAKAGEKHGENAREKKGEREEGKRREEEEKVKRKEKRVIEKVIGEAMNTNKRRKRQVQHIEK